MFNQNCCGPVMPLMMPGCAQEIVEPAVHKCVEKCFYHEVPHVCPVHTHVINKHLYNHTYRPYYSYSEESQAINNDYGNCCNFINR